MKKYLVLIILLLSTVMGGMASVFAQGSALSANRNTALRCLKLAENCLLAKDWSNALKQADLGLTYDDSISDLIYVKAAAQINQDKTKAYVLNLISQAFDKNNWLGYNKNRARILYADLLSDTGLYSRSMSVLDSNPLIYSADAEFIRIKNLYRMGDEESINNARLKLNTARRVYPDDIRFPTIFFMFEYMYMDYVELSGQKYEIPEIVNTVASYYITKLPDYSSKHEELELYAAFFAQKEEQVRLVKAIEAKHSQAHPLLSLLALKTGLYSDAQAMESFFAACGESVSLRCLDILVLNITDPEVQKSLMEKLLNYQGKLYIDDNMDLQEEVEISYETGRPKEINYDKNNDGVKDVSVACDFGAPLIVNFEENKSQVLYAAYPSVSKVSFLMENFAFNFLQGEFNFEPFQLTSDPIISSLGIDFYLAEFNQTYQLPLQEELILKSSSVSIPITERSGACVKYNTIDGNLVYANFYDGDFRYAYCDFNSEFPIVRYVDFDNDSFFETTEYYSLAEDKSLYNAQSVEAIFGPVLGEYQIYLQKVMIDRNGNTCSEFCESYQENNGKITLWDNDDNGVWDCQYIRHPQKEGDNLIEETVFFDTNGLPLINLSVIDSIPVKMMYKEQEVMIYAGQSDHIYWIEDNGSPEMEEEILESSKHNAMQGIINLIVYKGIRISVIKIGYDYFCKILPDSDLPEPVKDSQTTQEIDEIEEIEEGAEE